VSHQNWCKVSQQKPVVVGGQSGNHRKSFTPELVQSFAAKASSRRCQAITVKVSHQNWCKVSQQKPNWCKVSQQKPVVVHTRTGAKFRSKAISRTQSSGNHRKSFTPELVQSFAAKANSRM
ncbi:unnamed protein product, partial [Porites lobata]